MQLSIPSRTIAPISTRRRDILIALGLTLLAALTRIYGIWEWSILGDEVFTIIFADDRAGNLQNPASYILILIVRSVFGITEWSARLPFVIMGIATIPVYYTLCRKVVDRPTALIGSLFIIFCEWHLYHSQISRYYSAVVLFSLPCYFLYYRALTNDSMYYLGASLASGVIGIFFHVTVVMVPASCAAFSAYLLLRSSEEVPDYSRRIARWYFGLCVGVGVLTLPFFWDIAVAWASRGRPNVNGPMSLILDLLESIQIPLIVSAFFGLTWMLYRNAAKGIYFLCAIGVPVMGGLVAAAALPTVRGKYVIAILPMVITMSAYLCVRISDRLSDAPFVRHAVTLIVLAGLIPSFVSYYTGHISLDVRDPLQVIQQRYEPGDEIVLFSPSAEYNITKEFPEGTVHVVPGKSVWRETLPALEEESHRTWILVDTYRSSWLRADLESWLFENAALVWRKYEKRFDYSMKGYEIYLLNRRTPTE